MRLLLLSVLILAVTARADLTWKETTISLKAIPGQDTVEAHYHFTNAGKVPVEIQQVESSCGCTTAELEKRNYAPGESGEILAKFTVGARLGVQTKTVAVKTRGVEEPMTLTLVVDIPELLRIRPTFVYWVQGEAQKPKTMTIDVQSDAPVEKMTVVCSNAVMTPALKEVTKGLRYELTVIPARTDKVLFSVLTLNCDYGKGVTKSFRAYATVKPEGSEPQ